MAYGVLAWPLLALLVAQLATLLSSLFIILALILRSRREQQTEEHDSRPLLSEQGPSASLLLTLLVSYSLSGALLFSALFLWDLPSSLYFVFSTLSTVGFGDIVPEDSLLFLLAGGYTILGLVLYSMWQVGGRV